MKKAVMQLIIYSLFLILFFSLVSAHEEKSFFTKENTTKISLVFIILSSINACIWIVFAYVSKKNKRGKFVAIIIPIIITSVFLISTTILLNLSSETKGPVHWHADYEIWACGEKLNLIDPEGLSNKVGTNLLHEHNDDRMHIEGLVTDMEEVNLQHFIEAIAGKISSSAISLMTNEGPISYKNGDLCNGTLQVFIYKTDKWIVKQEKEENFLDYVLSSENQVPPGDCIIIEFEQEKDTTNRICETYKIALEKGEIHGS